MVRAVLLCACFVLIPGKGNADEIHKCASDEGIVYQGHPCNSHEMPLSAVASTAAHSIPDCAPRLRSPPRLPWRQATICIGMTDDEVLNLPGWGRPARIERMREQGLWHEHWIYEDGLSGRRQLHFVNAKLADADATPAAASEGSLASARLSD